jgi:RNA polymerase sigma-70 factor (ECF subfamily)
MPDQALRQKLTHEAALLDQARGRDPHAIRRIIQQHNQRLYRIARSILGDDSDAEDAMQEAYFRAFSRLDTFRGDARLGTWLSRIVINAALERRRGPNRTLALDLDAASATGRIIPFPGASFEPDPETIAAQRQIRILLEDAIDALPEGFRTILVARVIEGMSVQETAALFDIPPETVKTRLHRARRLLKGELAKHIGPVLSGAFPFAGLRCNRLTEAVIARLGLG